MAEEAAISSLKRVLDALDTHLASNNLLVGNSVTLADIVTVCNLYIGFTQLMTKSFISGFLCGKILLDHGESTKFQEGSGRGETDKSVSCYKEASQPKESVKPKPKDEPKKEEPAKPKSEPGEEEEAPKSKPKNPLDLLPPSKMILESG